MQDVDRQAIQQAVQDLPIEDQLEIAREILSRAQQTESEKLLVALRELTAIDVWLNAKPAVASARASVATLHGIAHMETPPDDATVQQWVEEHRLEKYGA